MKNILLHIFVTWYTLLHSAFLYSCIVVSLFWSIFYHCLRMSFVSF